MNSTHTNLDEIRLIGLTARTKNAAEMNPDTAKIGPLSGGYWSNNVAEQFQHRVSPGKTFCVYTHYETDENGPYTYFIGEEVSAFDGQDLSQFETLTIPAGHYQKISTPQGKMPDVVISTWQHIWQMTEKDFGGKRAYTADFEIHDERAKDWNNAMVEIYLAIK